MDAKKRGRPAGPTFQERIKNDDAKTYNGTPEMAAKARLHALVLSAEAEAYEKGMQAGYADGLKVRIDAVRWMLDRVNQPFVSRRRLLDLAKEAIWRTEGKDGK